MSGMNHALASVRFRSVPLWLALVSFALGGIIGHASSPPPELASPTMKPFVILFRQGPRQLGADALARRQQEIVAWARIQNDAGHKLEPRALSPEAVHPGIEKVTDAWPVTALLFLDARDLEQAADIARSHPANHYGVSVEVRPWSSPLNRTQARN